MNLHLDKLPTIYNQRTFERVVWLAVLPGRIWAWLTGGTLILHLPLASTEGDEQVLTGTYEEVMVDLHRVGRRWQIGNQREVEGVP